MLRDALLRSAPQHEFVLVAGVPIHSVKQPAQPTLRCPEFRLLRRLSLAFPVWGKEGAERRFGAMSQSTRYSEARLRPVFRDARLAALHLRRFLSQGRDFRPVSRPRSWLPAPQGLTPEAAVSRASRATGPALGPLARAPHPVPHQEPLSRRALTEQGEGRIQPMFGAVKNKTGTKYRFLPGQPLGRRRVRMARRGFPGAEPQGAAIPRRCYAKPAEPIE